MYVPIHNRENDREKIVAFMRQYQFAILVTSRDGNINATHLPVLTDERGDDLVLVAHVARGNVQWRDFGDECTALMIFQEPHAFISTRNYVNRLSVPTWNYVAVHAYGVPRILESLEERLNVVKRITQEFEGNLDQWNALPEEFRAKKAEGIVAFEMPVTRLDARFKLSQDRTPVEQSNIIETLTSEPESLDAVIGEMMQEHYKSNL